MDLDIEISKLKLLEANYKSNLYQLEEKILNFYPREILRLEELESQLYEDLNNLEPIETIDNETKFTKIEINGTTYTDKKIAAKELEKAIKDVKFYDNPVIGKYRNFKISVSYIPELNVVNLSLNGATKHSIELGESAEGNIVRMDNILNKIPKRIEEVHNKIDEQKEKLEKAKIEITQPFSKKELLNEKILRLSEVNQKLENDNTDNVVTKEDYQQNIKRSIIDFINREYEENHDYDEFDKLYPDKKHIGLAFTSTPDEKYKIQYEVDLEEKTYILYINNLPITVDRLMEDRTEEEALKTILQDMQYGEFSEFVSVNEDDLYNKLGLRIDDEGNFYDHVHHEMNNDKEIDSDDL